MWSYLWAIWGKTIRQLETDTSELSSKIDISQLKIVLNGRISFKVHKVIHLSCWLGQATFEWVLSAPFDKYQDWGKTGTYVCEVNLWALLTGTTGCSPLGVGLIAWQMWVYRILCIESYIYHSDVIVVAMQVNANKYKWNSTYYYQVYYIKTYYNVYLWSSESNSSSNMLMM